MINPKKLIRQLEENEVPLPFALRIYHRTIHKEKKPELPGFSTPEFSLMTNSGTMSVGMVCKSLLLPKDMEFYRSCEEVDVCPKLWEAEEAMSAYQTSVIDSREHERLFNKAVANEISERIDKGKKAVWVDIGIGEAEEVGRVYSQLEEDKFVLIGIDRFKGMLKKSLENKSVKKVEYHPIVAAANYLPFRNLDAIFTINTNTAGNLRRSEWESLDHDVSKSMDKNSVFFKSIYYAPSCSDRWTDSVKKFSIANNYFLKVPSARIASDMHEKKRTMKEALTKPLWSWQVFNEFTNSVEGYAAQWDNVKGCFEIEPVYRSHRFTRRELKESAERANLSINIERDGKERMYLVELRK